ncbi:hypothetical protein HON22_01195 [Candidatus Peregrinibacteria bacterium]|jgi:hypothetical protein|nr:hypothetical protein [Candidatus Peregrinibacteria bacterium]
MRKKPPQKGILSYFLPFFLLGIIIASGIYYINTSSNLSFSAKVPATLEIVKPGVKVLLKDKEEWLDIPESVSGVKLFRGDSVKTLNKGQAKIHLLKESFLYLDKNSSISINNLEEDDALRKTSIKYINGKALLSVSRILNPKSSFSLELDDIQLHSRGGIFIIDGTQLQILKGKVRIDKMSGKKVVTSTQIGVGQQIDLKPDSFGAFQEASALESQINLSDFVKTALGKTPTKEDNPLKLIHTPEGEEPTKEDGINSGDSMDTISTSSGSNLETENILKITNKKTELGIIELSEEVLELKGTVSNNALSVSVNGYQLSKFIKGETSWLYRAKEDFGNLKKGLNEYEVVAEYENNKKASESVTVEYTPKETSEADVSKTDSSEDSTINENTLSNNAVLPEDNSKQSSDLQLMVISPEEGEKIDTDPVTIRGTAPTGTAKIMVGDYALRTFKLGDAQWKYVASKQYGNLSIGEENKHLITAYDESDKEIASIQFSFFSTFIEEE